MSVPVLGSVYEGLNISGEQWTSAGYQKWRNTPFLPLRSRSKGDDPRTMTTVADYQGAQQRSSSREPGIGAEIQEMLKCLEINYCRHHQSLNRGMFSGYTPTSYQTKELLIHEVHRKDIL